MKTDDAVINFDIAVDVHGYRKKATKADKDLATALSRQSRELFLQLLTIYMNKGEKKYEFYERKKNKYVVRELK